MTRNITFFVFPDFQILDLTGPLSTFHIANAGAEGAAYCLRILSSHGGMIASTCGLAVMTEAADDAPIDTLIVAGGRGARAEALSETSCDEIRILSTRARRTASVCTGVFLVAAAGLFSGLRAATHWRFAASLQQLHPDIRVDKDAIFVRDGAMWSSAGITAGIDLSLALIEDDLGHDIAKATAQELVVYHRRPGGQSQFSAMLDLEPRSDRIRQALTFAREHLSEALTVERLAAAVCLSPRQFARAFRAETGETPARAVERLRAEAARVKVEAGREPIEGIAATVGFSDPERMRRVFLRTFGQPPQAMRRLARKAMIAD
jgi:transcriptional regulator GlxA family with amidase domain